MGCVLCNCVPNKTGQAAARAHNRNVTTLTDIQWHVGTGYALFRQVIFITNALLLGCAMSLVAAGIQQSDTDVGQWLGSTVYQILMAVVGTVLLTAVLGCTGSCYQNKVALLAYILVLCLLVLAEGAIMFLISSSELDTILEQNWETLNAEVQSEIEREFECEGAADCIDSARDDAQLMILLIYYVVGGIVLYQVMMVCMTAFYIRGLKKKKKHIDELKDTTMHRYENNVVRETALEEVAVDDLRGIRYGV